MQDYSLNHTQLALVLFSQLSAAVVLVRHKANDGVCCAIWVWFKYDAVLSAACASISLHGWGDTQWPINPPLLSSSHSPSFSPPRNGVRSHSRCGTESWTELELAFQVLWPSWLDYRVPTTPCTNRLKTKKTKTLSTYQENIAWIKSSWNIGGDIRDHVPPVQMLGGRVPPVP